MGQNRQSLLKVVIFSALILILYGCGDIGGGGQGGGSGDSGLYLAVTVTPNDTVNSQNDSVDVVQNLDCDGDGSGTLETFGPHSADVTLKLDLVEGATSPPAADEGYILTYTIDYTLNTGPGPSTPLASVTYGKTVTVVLGTPTTELLYLMDINKKAEYGTPSGPSGYTLTYTFYGEDKYGNNISARAFTTVTIDDFNNCSTGGST